MNTSEPVKTKKKMKTWKKVLIIVLISILSLMVILGAVAYGMFEHYYGKIDYVPLDDPNETIISVPDEVDVTDPVVTDEQGSEVTAEPQPPVTEDPNIQEGIDQNINNGGVMQFDKNIRNILLVGSDGRTTKERGRSDSMIILSINNSTNQIVMTSLMRDVYLHIPEIDSYNRINASYAYGGVPLLTKTIKENFKIEIDEYVRINFESFKYIVDTLGGVDIELSQEEINYLGMQNQATPGLVHLNGTQALGFCRCRYIKRGNVSADFARTQRQREFLTIMSEKLKGMSLTDLTRLLDIFLPYVTTNLTRTDMLGLLANTSKYLGYEIKSYRLPIDGSWKYAKIRGMSVLSVDFDKNIEALEKMIKGTY